jgi:hypothetical protein
MKSNLAHLAQIATLRRCLRTAALRQPALTDPIGTAVPGRAGANTSEHCVMQDPHHPARKRTWEILARCR